MRRLIQLHSLGGVALMIALVFVAPARLAAADSPAASSRGGRVGWARMITPNSDWGIHSDHDDELASFIRQQTTLNIDPTWYTVEPGSVEKLCTYPFIYVKTLSSLSAASEIRNVAEYLERGGFICIDPCVSGYTQGRRDAFVQRHIDWFARVIPGSVGRELPDTHAIYHCYFNVGVDDVFSPDMVRAGAGRPDNLGLLGIYKNDRLIALISMCGLECGWPETPGRTSGCMKMIVNAYVYAMTRGHETVPVASAR